MERLKPQKRGFFQSILCCWRRNRTKTNQNGTPIDGSTTPPPLPDQQRYLLPQVRHSDMHKKCMVIDLDETLVHSSFKVSYTNALQLSFFGFRILTTGFSHSNETGNNDKLPPPPLSYTILGEPMYMAS